MEPNITQIILQRLNSIDRKLDDVVTWKAVKYIGAAIATVITVVEFIIHQVAKT